MADPRITDNDAGEITATVRGQEVRGWSYKTRGEQREKMQMAHEFAEGWFQATHRAAKLAEDYDGDGITVHGYHDQLGDAGRTRNDIAAAIKGENQ